MHDLKPKEKRMARIAALQCIYALEYNANLEGIEEMLNEFILLSNKNLTNDVKLKVMDYSSHLRAITLKHKQSIDQLIKKRSENWAFGRITILDKLILRMSLAEMLYEDSVPPKVSIAEGVEIAKQFSTNDSSSFINGILDAIYNNMIMKQNNK